MSPLVVHNNLQINLDQATSSDSDSLSQLAKISSPFRFSTMFWRRFGFLYENHANRLGIEGSVDVVLSMNTISR
ncbi:DUF2138 family protein [Escherichia coli]